MGEQLIISISREYGSGGHEIARKLADRLELAFYDRCMLDEIAEQMNADVSDFHKYDEKPGNRLLSRRVGNHTNSYEEIIAQFQFDYIRKKAESGESFVVVGRCSENVLKDYDCLISVFVTGDKEHKIKLLKELYYKKYLNTDNQKESLDRWLDFLFDKNTKYPMWAKYWVFQGMLKIGNYSHHTNTYQKRSKSTLAPFIELNYEVLNKCFEIIIASVEKEEILNDELELLVKSGNFQKMYIFLLEKHKQNLLLNSDKNDSCRSTNALFEAGNPFLFLSFTGRTRICFRRSAGR